MLLVRVGYLSVLFISLFLCGAGITASLKDSSPREKELKELVLLAEKMKKVRESRLSEDVKARKAAPIEEEADRLAAKLTGLDPKKDSKIFDEAAFRVLLEGAKKYDHKFYVELQEMDKKRKILATQVLLKDIETALETYQIDTGRYPGNENGLSALIQHEGSGPYIDKEMLSDPWGHLFVYHFSPDSPKGFVLFSTGPDGIPGTADDISLDEPASSKPGSGQTKEAR